MARGTKKIGPVFPLPQTPKEEKVEEQPVTEAKEEKVEEKQKIETRSVVEEVKLEPQSVAKEEDHQPEQGSHNGGDLEEVSTTNIDYGKYKKRPKYETHVPHNTRIPRELRREMEKIGKKLGVPLNKNSGFFQEFTIDALWAAVERAKKELGID